MALMFPPSVTSEQKIMRMRLYMNRYCYRIVAYESMTKQIGRSFYSKIQVNMRLLYLLHYTRISPMIFVIPRWRPSTNTFSMWRHWKAGMLRMMPSIWCGSPRRSELLGLTGSGPTPGGSTPSYLRKISRNRNKNINL